MIKCLIICLYSGIFKSIIKEVHTFLLLSLCVLLSWYLFLPPLCAVILYSDQKTAVVLKSLLFIDEHAKSKVIQESYQLKWPQAASFNLLLPARIEAFLLFINTLVYDTLQINGTCACAFQSSWILFLLKFSSYHKHLYS